MVHLSQRSDGSAARHRKKSPIPKTNSSKLRNNRMIIEFGSRRGRIVARRHLGGRYTARLASGSQGLRAAPRLEWRSISGAGDGEHPPADALVVRADRDR